MIPYPLFLFCVFWRTADESLTRHRNPIFSLGSPNRLLAIDSLHVLYLGVMLVFCRHVLWAFLEEGLFGRFGSIEQQIAVGLMAVRSSLAYFYFHYDRAHRSSPLTRINKFGSKHVGSNEDRQLKTKGAQTWFCCCGVLRS